MHESWKVLFKIEMNRLWASESIQASIHFNILFQIYSLNVHVRDTTPKLLDPSMQIVNVENAQNILLCW